MEFENINPQVEDTSEIPLKDQISFDPESIEQYSSKSVDFLIN